MGIPVQQGDTLFISAASVTVPQTFRCTLNIRLKTGVTTSDTLDVSTAAARTGVTASKALGFDGEIVSAAFDILTGTQEIQPGMTYLTASIIRGGTIAIQFIGGYWYQGHIPSYPGEILGPLEGPGRRYVALGANPAANAEVADTVPTRAMWRLIAIEVVLVTDANAANRTVNFFVDDAGTPVTRSFVATDSTAQTATLTRTHAWYEGNDTPTTASVSVTDTVTILAKYPLNLPLKYLLPAGSNLRTVTAARQVGDDYGAARYQVEEWLTGA